MANAATKEIDGIDYSYDHPECPGEAFVENASHSMTDVIIPSKVTIDGVVYSVTKISSKAFWYHGDMKSISIPNSVTSIGSQAFYNCSSLTSISIPNSVTSIEYDTFEGCSSLATVSIPNSVTVIGNYAFKGCSSLTSVSIPNSVTIIGCDAFSGCSSLISVTIPNAVTVIQSSTFSGCSSLTSVNMPNSVTSIEGGAFYNCTSLTSITIPNGVEDIGDGAFRDCVILSSISIPSSVTNIGSYAFYNCSSLSSISIPNSVTNIGSSAFEGCYVTAENFINESSCKSENLWGVILADSEQSDGILVKGDEILSCRKWATSITIPENITSIGQNAFRYCKKLTKVVIPESITNLGNGAFADCACDYIRFMGKPSKFGYSVFRSFSGVVYAAASYQYYFTNAGLDKSQFYAIEGGDWDKHITPLIKGFRCNNPYAESYLGIKNVKFFLSDDTELAYTKTDAGAYLVKGLMIDRTQTVKVVWTDAEGQEKSQSFSLKTVRPTLELLYSSSQSMIRVNGVDASSDESCVLNGVKVSCQGKYYTEFPVKFSDKCPGDYEYITYYASYDGEEVSDYMKVHTSSLYQLVLTTHNYYDPKSTASSFNVSTKYTKGDAVITDEKVQVNGKTYVGNSAFVSGLDPNKEYTVTYTLKANGREYSASGIIKTSPLSLKTSQPKVISPGNVIVAAESNIDDAETNVGFEWRRTDWTDDFSSNTGTAYMYNGQMEGYIRNLYTEKLWKYRPYYLSDSGTYYYGDWVGLDPTNTSYFEATVHTYNQITVEGNTALVKGYALRGTDDIKVQGFVYWKRVANVKGQDGRLYAASVPGNAKTVEAKGQIMTATLPDLDYSSEYCYMAFVTTSAGDTFYGEEMTFKTGEDTTGINDVEVDASAESAVSIMGYYDLNGRRMLKPQRGMYIIRYSDGTSRKMMGK